MGILDLFFPKTCLGCGRSGQYICENCIKKVKTPKPVCPECLKPAIDGMTHSKCLRPLGLNGLISLWNYDGVVRKAILALKYKLALEIAGELSIHAFGAFQAHSSYRIIHNSFALAPVPLYWYKKNFRGFNQSEEIGKRVAGIAGWKFEPNLLIRKMLKVPQTDLTREKRLSNIRGVFEVNSSSYALSTMDYPLILFDDVWTTGSTLREAAKVLKRAGAEKVWGLTLARGIS